MIWAIFLNFIDLKRKNQLLNVSSDETKIGVSLVLKNRKDKSGVPFKFEASFLCL